MSETVRELALDSNIFTTNEKLIDMDPVLYKKFPETTPLLSIKTRLAVGPKVINETIYWANQHTLPVEVNYSGTAESSASAGAGTLTIANYTYLREGDTLLNARTGEVILVTATPSTSTVSVYRGFAGTATALNANETLLLGPESGEEAQDQTTARSVVGSEDYNYVQPFSEFVKMSTLANAESTIHGPEGAKYDQMVQDMERAWAKKIENALWMGGLAKRLLSGETGYRRAMKGVTSWLRSGTNYTQGGLLTESGFNAFLRKLYTSFPDKGKVTLFTSAFVRGIISEWGRGKLTTSTNQTTYGMRVDNYIGDLDVDIIVCPMWNDSIRQGWAIALDMERIKLRYMSHPRLSMDIQPETAKYRLSEYYTVLSMTFATEAAHGMMYGITG